MFGGGRSVLLDDMSLIKRGGFREYANSFAWDMGRGAATGRLERQVKRSTDERSAPRQATLLPGSPARLPARNVSSPDHAWGPTDGPGATQAQLIQSVNIAPLRLARGQ
jgi:hypothetical protein